MEADTVQTIDSASLKSLSFDEIRGIAELNSGLYEKQKAFLNLKDRVLRAFANICEGTRRPCQLQGVRVLDLSPVTSSACRQLGTEGMSALVEIVEEGCFEDFLILDLSDNEAGSEAVAKLASSFESKFWRQLQQLRLNGNRVGDVGARALADAFLSDQLSSLENLDLSFNHIGDGGAKSIAESLRLGRLGNLQMLDLSFNEFGDEGTEALAQSFGCGRMSNLKSLNLSHNVVGNVGATALAKSFTTKHRKDLRVLDLSFNNIQDEGALTLASFFQSNDHPNKFLHLSDNSIGYSPTKMTDLCKEFLSGAWQTLELCEGKFEVKEDLSAHESSGSGATFRSKSRTLFLSGPGFVGDMRVVALVKALLSGTSSKWESLVLRDRIGDEGATALSECLQSSQFEALRNLNLSETTLEDVGLMALAIGFRTPQLENLEFLNLSNNGVGNSGAMALAESFALGHMSSVMAIDLKGNRVGYEGAEALVGSYLLGRWDEVEPYEAKAVLGPAESPDGLRKSRVLYLARNEELVLVLAKSLKAGLYPNAEAIELHDEGLNDEEVMVLAEALRSGKLSSLQRVDLSKNKITDLGLIPLLQAFQTTHSGNAAGLDLDLSYNRIGDAGARALAESYGTSQSNAFRQVNLNYNSGITEAGAIALLLAFHSGEWRTLCFERLAKYENAGKFLQIGPGEDWELKKLLENLGVQSPQFGQMQNLRTLDISRSDVNEAALVALANVVRSGIFGRLENIKFTNVEAKDKGIAEIAGALEADHLPFLKALELFRYASQAHGISEAAARALVNAYRTNTTLIARIYSEDSFYFRRKAPTGVIRDVNILRRRNEKWAGTLEALKDEPEISGTHGKVFLCGFPGVGKTTLSRTLSQACGHLFGPEGRGAQQPAPTRGIEISYIGSDGIVGAKPLTLALWDLAGQPEYEVLHSSFLPDFALADGQATFFVILCNANESQGNSALSAQKHLDYWLKFISSNSVEDPPEDRRRRVLVVLNCFNGDDSGHDLNDWKFILKRYQERFANFLNIHDQPFILDAKDVSSLTLFKTKLEGEATSVLQRRKMPQICVTLQEMCKEWARNHARYPVLTWVDYARHLGRRISRQKLTAATEYLHEAGHLILFRNDWQTSSTNSEGDADNMVLVILDPDWFCQKVVGYFLLPEQLFQIGEQRLMDLMEEDGSLPIVTLPKTQLDVPAEKIDQVLVLLLRLGLCYKIHPDAEKIFVPALIQQSDAVGWCESNWRSESLRQAWVMGFSLHVKDSRTTLLPIVPLRRLQVELARRSDIGGRHDCFYRAWKSCITYTYEGMDVLVEYIDDTTSSVPNHLNVLIKPLMDDSQFSSQKRRQVNLAQRMVDALVNITTDHCPGVALEQRIIKPWKVVDGWKHAGERDFKTSVKAVQSRVEKNGLGNFNWPIGGVQVTEAEVLSDRDLRVPLASICRTYVRTEEAIVTLTRCDVLKQCHRESKLESEVPSSSSRGLAELEPDLEPQRADGLNEVKNLLREIKSSQRDILTQIRKGFIQTHQRLEEGLNCVGTKLEEIAQTTDDVKGTIHSVFDLQTSLNLRLQNLERFSFEEKALSVPRFVYLKEAGKGKWIVTRFQKKFTKMFVKSFKLHFLCEAPQDGTLFHEVESQAGVDVKAVKDWVIKLAPILDWTLRIAIITARVASNAVLPGLGLAIPDIPPDTLNNVIRETSGLAELSEKLWRTMNPAETQQSSSDLIFDTNVIGNSDKTRGARLNPNNTDPYILRGEARAAVKELLDGLKAGEMGKQVGLRRVWLDDGRGGPRRVVYICHECHDKYGHEKAGPL